jgi:hypothetical protein
MSSSKKKISELPQKDALAPSDLVPIVDTESARLTTKKTTVADLAAAVDAVPNSDRGVPGGVATINPTTGKLEVSQLPPLAVTETFTVSSAAAMLALPAQMGDFAVRLDANTTYILAGNSAATLADWQEIIVPPGSLAGLTDVNTGDPSVRAALVFDPDTQKWRGVALTTLAVNGADGATGVTGPSGATGPAGAVGATGATGAAGLIGAVGATGLRGVTGATGVAGPSGSIGPSGPAGVSGATGATGVAGPTGEFGPRGATGPRGPTGVAGDQGATGATGAVGRDGATGVQGATGVIGATGVAGVRGITGATGPVGATGVGATGIQGATGPAGVTVLSALTDVVVSGIATGDVLRYNDGKWRNYGEENLTDGGNF